jgi:hypothetical protein
MGFQLIVVSVGRKPQTRTRGNDNEEMLNQSCIYTRDPQLIFTRVQTGLAGGHPQKATLFQIGKLVGEACEACEDWNVAGSIPLELGRSMHPA